VATVVADALARLVLRDSILTEKLSRRGVRVPADFHADPYRVLSVRDVMTHAVETLGPDATVADARARVAGGGHGAYPVVDSGRVIGIVGRSDVLDQRVSGNESIGRIARSDVVTVDADDLAANALERMVEEGVDHLPVLLDGRLVGICTRTDLLRVRARLLDAERPQPGWRPVRSRLRVAPVRSSGPGAT